MASRIYCAILFAIFYFGLADATRTKKSIGQLPGPIQASTNNIRPGSCGQTSVPIQVVARQRIVNGNKAKPHSIPWIINLRYTVFEHHCGAALIRVSDTVEQSDIILTAAHCLLNKDISDIEVVAGTHYRTSRVPGEVSVRIAEQVFHPNGGSDFVIVKLTKPIKFSRTIQPICLPEQNETLPFGTAGIAAGWGAVGEHQGDANVELQRVVLKTNNKCDPNLWICHNQPHRNVCKGDSGGPFFFAGKKGYTLHGIASHIGGSECGGTNPAGYHVRVSVYIDWIQDQVKKLTSVK